MKQVKVLIVDNSPTMRAVIRTWLQRDGEIVVVGEAGDPFEAREAVKALAPDVITLDVNMPHMDGLEFLRRLMRLRPTPVVMVSSEVGAGAASSIEALAVGAFDCVAKPVNGKLEEAFASLAATVKAAAAASTATLGTRTRHVSASPEFEPNGRIVTIGASTGGVDALISVLSAFPQNCPPTLIAQHMPASFTRSLAHRLNQHCAAEVAEARDGEPLTHGRVYLAPGGETHLEVMGRQRKCCRLTTGEPRAGHRPSVDALFESAAALGSNAVGVILTGMGRDGADGLLAMRRAGARTIGQDEATSLVYGMPRAAADLGAVERQLALEAIPAAILSLCAANARMSS